MVLIVTKHFKYLMNFRPFFIFDKHGCMNEHLGEKIYSLAWEFNGSLILVTFVHTSIQFCTDWLGVTNVTAFWQLMVNPFDKPGLRKSQPDSRVLEEQRSALKSRALLCAILLISLISLSSFLCHTSLRTHSDFYCLWAITVLITILM